MGSIPVGGAKGAMFVNVAPFCFKIEKKPLLIIHLNMIFDEEAEPREIEFLLTVLSAKRAHY